VFAEIFKAESAIKANGDNKERYEFAWFALDESNEYSHSERFSHAIVITAKTVIATVMVSISIRITFIKTTCKKSAIDIY